MSRMELPENWDELTPDEKDIFYQENARAPSGWGRMSEKERSDYFKHNCDCADIIYEDIRNYLMCIPRFKQAYTILKSPYNLRSKKHTNDIVAIKKKSIYTIILSIMDEIEQYSRLGIRPNQCPHLIDSCFEFYEKGHLNSVKNKHWFSVDAKISRIEGKHNIFLLEKNEKFSYYQQVYYEPTLRWYYNRPCKCSFLRNSEWISMYGDVEDEMECISCETFVDFEILIRGGFIVNMFNILTEIGIKEQILDFIKVVDKLGIALKKKIIEFSKIQNDEIFTRYWKGADYYYRKLFFGSIYLDSLNIPNDILKQRYECNFDAMICGHPKASDGWFAEALKEFEEYIEYINSQNPIF